MDFKTKTDKNGNTYTLSVDLNSKTYRTNGLASCEDRVITRHSMRNMIYELKECGFTEEYEGR